jgi:hypothetical protein
MTILRGALAALLLCGGLTAVRADDSDETAEDARTVLRTYCKNCHAGPDDQVKGEVQVFDVKQLVQRKVVRRNDAEHSELFQLVECGSMPPGNLPKPGPPEVQTLRAWISAGAPAFPAEYGETYVLKKIQKDLATLDAKERPFQRYISFNHLLADDPPAEEQAVWRDALLKALNHLSLQKQPVPVTPIDPPANTIFRVDERLLGWDVQPFEAKDPNDPKADARASRVDLFDLILLEYPYATLPSKFAASDPQQKLLADYVRKANPVRPILYVRGDWLVSTATQPPLYEDLLRLPRTLTGKDGLMDKIGAAGKPAAQAGFLNSVMSGMPQFVERRPTSSGAYWRTFDLGSAGDMKSLLHEAAANDIGERGGLMLFTLPNGFNGYYIAENVPDEMSKRLTRLASAAPKELVADPEAADRIARNGLSCMRCHVSGVQPFADAARLALDDAPAADKARLVPLFPGKGAMNSFIALDGAIFLSAVKAVHGGLLQRDPLTPVTRRYCQGKAGPVVPALLDGGAEAPAAPLLTAGDRDRPNIARIPAVDTDAPQLPPLDGLTAPDYRPPLPPVDVTIRAVNVGTGKPTPTFYPGDMLAIEIINQSKNDVYFELIGAFMDGKMNINQPLHKLAAGQTYQYPQDRTSPPGGVVKKSLPMGLPPGVDRYILFAADREFPEGVRLRSSKEKDIGDRVVHPFWEISEDGTESTVRFDPSHLIKKTLSVETREK